MKKYCFFYTFSVFVMVRVNRECEEENDRERVRALAKGFYGPLVDDLLGILNLVHKLGEKKQSRTKALSPSTS